MITASVMKELVRASPIHCQVLFETTLKHFEESLLERPCNIILSHLLTDSCRVI